MRRDDEKLVDFLLGEIGGEEAREFKARLAADRELAARERIYSASLSLLREAAADGWTARRGRMHRLRPALALAAVLAAAVTLLFLNRSRAPDARRVFDPDGSYGYLRAEELDRAGQVAAPSTVSQITVRSGSLEVAAIGSERVHRVGPGDILHPDHELRSGAESGVRIDLPHGGILFLGPVTTVQLRLREDGETAVRLRGGMACTVAGTRPIHLAVDGTDLLLRQERGAAALRFSPPEVVNLRGTIRLRRDERRIFEIPVGERLPAACTNSPRSVAVTDDKLGLDWYRDLVYARHRVEPVEWLEPQHRSRAIRFGPKTLLYLRVVPNRTGILRLRFGAGPRDYRVRSGAPLELRLRLGDLGPGPYLELEHDATIREARIVEFDRKQERRK